LLPKTPKPHLINKKLTCRTIVPRRYPYRVRPNNSQGNFNDLRITDIPQKMLTPESFVASQCVNVDIPFSELIEV